MNKILFFTLIYFLLAINVSAESSHSENSSENIWLKTYQNYKNYNRIISKISKTEARINANSKNPKVREQLEKKLDIYRSKLPLYEKNHNFDSLLLMYKFESKEITLREFLAKNYLDNIEKLILKYQVEKNNFYLAKSVIQNLYNAAKKGAESNKKLLSLKEDIEYFEEYSENIEKMHQNLLESKEELTKKYQEYKQDVFYKHLLTIGIVIIIYIVEKLFSFIALQTVYRNNKESHANFSKLLTLLFYIVVLTFLIFRYIDDFLYIITFLSVIAAALTIATREIILNLAGAIYIFFSRIIRVGDRIMVQFETKHTIGDIEDISLIKIKLKEIEDYSNLKEIKNVGRTIYIPNSYVFTKVFYNYALKNNGIINDLIEFDFDLNNDFDLITQTITSYFEKIDMKHRVTFTLNSLKTGIVGLISYEVNYKLATKKRGEISIELLKEFQNNPEIKLKAAKKTSKTIEESGDAS